MEQKKRQTNLLMTPKTHLRLKINAAMLGMSLGDLVAYMVERMFPHKTIEDALYFSRSVDKMEAEESHAD